MHEDGGGVGGQDAPLSLPPPIKLAAAGAMAPKPDPQAPGDANAQSRTKKQFGKKGKKGAGAAQEEVALTASQAAHVNTYRVEPDKRRDGGRIEEDRGPMVLSKLARAPNLQLGEDRLSVSGTKGFRSVRATRGAFQGTWYCEATVKHLGPTGHVRLGWATARSELQAPVGFDKYGFSYRDVEGSKVHVGLREPYGAAYGEGDVVGLIIHMPDGGRPIEVHDRAVTRYKGGLYQVSEQEPEPQPLQGSAIAFTCNGKLQGVAYSNFLEGTYYPAASLFTAPSQTEGATVTFNFGPKFMYECPQLDGLPPALPCCDMPSAAALAADALGADGAAAVSDEGAAAAMSVDEAGAVV